MAVPHRHSYSEEPVVADERVAWQDRFSPAQIVAFAGGIFFIVLGAVGLARAGLSSMTEPSVTVAGLSMTPLLAIAHLVVGALVLAGASGPTMARSMLSTMGAVLIAAGIIALIEPIESLGWNDANGIAYLITAGVFLIAALLTPGGVVRERIVA